MPPEKAKLPNEAIDLYNRYIHGEIGRRDFLEGVKRFAVAGLTTGAMIEALMPNLDRIESYPLTKPVGQLYRTAFPELSAGAKQLRDAITAGDSAGVVAGSQQIAKGLGHYGPIRQQIAALVEQAIVQQRLYLK